MRLGQLARKLSLRPLEIVEFLAENRIQIAEGANVRLENDQVSLIMKKFVPGWIETSEEVTEADEELAIENVSLEQPIVNEEISFSDNNSASPDTNVANSSATIEVIKAPKVELSGLKVLGKIELPEPKKKEAPANPITEEQPQATEIDNKGVKGSRRPYEEKRRREYRPEKNPIALQREREAKDAQKKLQEQLEREKDKKTQNYLRKVKMSPPTKAVRLVNEPVMEMTAEELVEPPKTLFGKIIRWLTKAS